MYIFSGVITGRVNCTSKGRANCSEVLTTLVSNVKFVFTVHKLELTEANLLLSTLLLSCGKLSPWH